MITYLKTHTERSLLVLILFTAAFLRFFNVTALSLSSDELSLITDIREQSFTGFFSLSNLSESGPAGLYTIMYFWMKIFGSSVFMFRLPFIIFGISSVYLSYLLAQKWFNQHAALFVAASMCFIEYAIQFSQTAYSEGLGLFFTLLAVLFWTKILFDEVKEKRNDLYFAISFALTAYINYYALIFLSLVYISGFFFISKNSFKSYFKSLLFVIILYIPNIPIIIYELSHPLKSILPVHEQTWIFEHIEFVFNSSFILLYTVLAIFIISNIAGFGEIKVGKFHILSVVWFLCPFAYFYIYSLMAKPMPNNSVLLYSMPFLLFSFFSFICTKFKTYNLAVIPFFLIIGIYTLIAENKYYNTYHFGEYRDIAKKTLEWDEQYGEKNITRTINVYNPSYINYYFEKFDRSAKFSLYKNDGKTDMYKLHRIIETSKTPYFLYAWSSVFNPHETDYEIRTKYPYLIKNIDYNEMAGIALYSVNKNTETIPDEKPLYYNFNGFEEKNTLDKDSSILTTEKVKYGKYAIKLDSKHEYGPTYSNKLSKISNNSFKKVSISLWAYAEGVYKDAQIVAELKFSDEENQQFENYFWLSSKFKYFIERGKWGQVFFSFNLPELRSVNDEIKIYVWNPDKNPLYIDNMEIKFLEK